MSDIIILVNVTLPLGGKPFAVAKLLFGDKPAPDPLNVQIGDKIAWYVQVATTGGRKALPYKVTFQDNTLFGVDSIAVPSGGASPFLTVNFLKGKTKYSVAVAGLGTVLDPEIQTGIDIEPTANVVPSAFLVTWNIDHNTFTYQKDGGGSQPFPMLVTLGDTVAFVAAARCAPEAIVVVFPGSQNQNSSWASPFDPNEDAFPSKVGAGPSVGPLKVADGVDKNNPFVFHIETADASARSGDGQIKII